MSKPINISLPGSGMIATMSKRYDALTDAFIQQWLFDLYEDYLVEPEYLLVSQSVRRELHRIVIADMSMVGWVNQYRYSEGEAAERYPNKITGSPLAIVVFPGLPEKTLFVASMLTIAEETVQTDGLGHEIVNRKFARLSKD